MIFNLSAYEIQQVALVGVQRRMENLGAHHAHGFKGTDSEAWGMHIEGAAAEFVVAKWRGKFWNAVVAADEFRDLEGDVGHLQVRSTARPNGALILHESDPDDAYFVLVTGAIPTLRIAGYILGYDGKHPSFWRTDTGRPAFFVPQPNLSPIRAVAA